MRHFFRLALVLVVLGCGCQRSRPPVAEVPDAAVEVEEPPDAGAPQMLEVEDAGEPMVAELTLLDAGPHRSSVLVATDPPDAAIFVNHVSVGQSPLAVQVPAQGVLNLSAEMPGYQVAEQTVWPGPTQPKAVVMTLLPVMIDAGAVVFGPLTLIVESFPSPAYVMIDRVDAGMTPLKAAVTPGPHEVIVLYAGYLRDIQFVDGGVGESKRIFAKLVPGF